MDSRARMIRLLVLDVDGVLTQGGITYDSEGERLQTFHVRDGMGLRLLQATGVETAIISGRLSVPVQARARDLGIEHIYLNERHKKPVLDSLLERLGLSPEQTAYMGDDLNDIPCLQIAGLAMAPADAVPEVRRLCHFISGFPGGQGAVRDACRMIMRAQGTWENAVQEYFQ
ncbi:MAG: HAD-IIIA family hydrolase [Desulfarculales bacterium]|jgi:3-deoxy-D-manno-octulosonate 8-phosphate phosphatase (KDO 8-P phosphatase)|nr:HAD-IIIA family hydrolase [Desulfarculales bacterium]